MVIFAILVIFVGLSFSDTASSTVDVQMKGASATSHVADSCSSCMERSLSRSKNWQKLARENTKSQLANLLFLALPRSKINIAFRYIYREAIESKLQSLEYYILNGC
jgi:hypothetical protein